MNQDYEPKFVFLIILVGLNAMLLFGGMRSWASRMNIPRLQVHAIEIESLLNFVFDSAELFSFVVLKVFHRCSVTAHRSRFWASIKKPNGEKYLRIRFAFGFDFTFLGRFAKCRRFKRIKHHRLRLSTFFGFAQQVFRLARQLSCCLKRCFVTSSRKDSNSSVHWIWLIKRRSLFHRETL